MTEDTGLTHADVERIVQLAEDAGFGYVHFESDGLEVTLVKDGYGDRKTADIQDALTTLATPDTGTALTSPPAEPADTGADVDEATAGSSADTAEDAASADEIGLVRSPMTGIFYRAPDPESPPYVEVGRDVRAGATVGLVEVMKMYTAIRTEVSGRVVEILAGNAEEVERGQPLVRIEPT